MLLILCGISIAWLYILIKELSIKHGEIIRTIWYFFSLSIVITTTFSVWAISKGVIIQNGVFQGDNGNMLHNLLEFVLDLKTDFLILISIFVVIVLPQLISYILSGLSGNAPRLFFINATWKLLIWGIVKALITCSGIFFSFAVIYIYNQWDYPWKHAIAFLYMSLMLLIFSFMIAFLNLAPDVLYKLTKKCATLEKIILTLHKCSTRKERS